MDHFICVDVGHTNNELMHDFIAETTINIPSLSYVISQTVFTKLHLYVHNWKQTETVGSVVLGILIFECQVWTLLLQFYGLFCHVFGWSNKTKSTVLRRNIRLLKLSFIFSLFLNLLKARLFLPGGNILDDLLIGKILTEFCIFKPASVIFNHVGMGQTV